MVTREDSIVEVDFYEEIRIQVGRSPLPELVIFHWAVQSNHRNWLCLDHVTSWLKDNDVWFTVSSYMSSGCEIYVHDPEARTMLKLKFQAAGAFPDYYAPQF